MFRLRPVVEYVPALPRPDEERDANNKIFLGMVAKRLMKDGGPNPAFVQGRGRARQGGRALMTDVMTFDDTKTKPYLHGFEIGIATEARMGGGSARNADGSYKSGDGWGWSAMKPFQTSDGTGQAYVNVAIPGFWTAYRAEQGRARRGSRSARRGSTRPIRSTCPATRCCAARRWASSICPATKDGKVDQRQGRREQPVLRAQEEVVDRATIALEDGRRDLGEENGMTCSQCHIRNFGMHDYSDPANVDPSAGVPKAPNHAIADAELPDHPDRRDVGGVHARVPASTRSAAARCSFEQFLGADAAKGLTCPLAK